MQQSIRITGAASLIKKFKAHPALLNRTQVSVCTQEARSLCVEYGAVSMPGPGLNDGGNVEAFRNRVDKEIGKVFAVRSNPGQIYRMMKVHAPHLAKAYWHAFKSNKPRAMAELLRKANLPQGLDPAMHKRARSGRKGRVPGHPVPQTLATEAQVRAYGRKQRALVGFAKAGWFCAAKALGGRVRRNLVDDGGKRRTEEIFPQYIRTLARRFPDAGGARVTVGDARVTVEIFTNVAHAREALSDSYRATADTNAQQKLAAALALSVRTLNEKIFNSRSA